MISGVLSTSRFVAAIAPRKSDAITTIVRLNPSEASPGGTLVLRVGDVDQDAESLFNSVGSLLFGGTETARRVGPCIDACKQSVCLRFPNLARPQHEAIDSSPIVKFP